MRPLFLLLFVAIAVAPASGRSNVASIWGRLTVVGDRGPVEGAVVRVVGESRASSIEATADAKGRFARIGLQPGTYSATITREGYAVVEIVGIVARAGRRIRLDIELTPIDEAPFKRERRQFRPSLVDPERTSVEYSMPSQ